MKCQCCGQIIENNSKYCSYCGATQYYYNYNYNNTYYNDNSLERSFIGPNYDKITSKTFSWPTFLFGPLYFFYRKMYLFGFLFFLVSGMFMGDFFISLILAFCFKPIYMYFVNNKLVYIKQQNPRAGNSELEEIARKKGGTSILAVGFVILIEFVLVIAAVALLISTWVYDDYRSYGNNDETETQEKHEQENRAIIPIEALKIEIPANYKKTISTTNNIVYKNSDNCSINIKKIDGEPNENNDSYTTEEINGFIWFQKNESNSTTAINKYKTQFQNTNFYVTFSCPKEKVKNNEKDLIKARDSMKFKQILSQLKYIIPHGYKIDRETSGIAGYHIEINDEDKCSISISTEENPYDEKSFKQQYIDRYQTIDFNNKKWYIVAHISASEYEIQRYATEHNGQLYNLELKDEYGRNGNGSCDEPFNQFKKTLIFEDDY